MAFVPKDKYLPHGVKLAKAGDLVDSERFAQAESLRCLYEKSLLFLKDYSPSEDNNPNTYSLKRKPKFPRQITQLRQAEAEQLLNNYYSGGERATRSDQLYYIGLAVFQEDNFEFLTEVLPVLENILTSGFIDPDDANLDLFFTHLEKAYKRVLDSIYEGHGL